MPDKRVHFIRHAQSQHNARAALVADEMPVRLDPAMRDAGLTDLGHAQARAIAPGIRKLTGIEVIVVTPLTRAIQTMRHAFADHQAPRLVLDLHREHQWSFCDIGQSPAALAAAFPDMAFDHLPDPWWHEDPDHPGPFAIETQDMLDARVEAFRAWLVARPEREIAVVGHGTFLNRLTGHWFDNTTRITVTL
jgi:broad specificity phosphatase PhoE